MAKMSRMLLSPKQQTAPVAEPPDETDAQESDESPTLQKQEKQAGIDKKKAKQPKQPSIQQMIRIAGMKRKK
jgi:hypothetical protein